jgi:hypothetical protein
MTEMLPNGFLTILQAADVLLPAMYGGLPDQPLVTQLRDQGLGVRDGAARSQAVKKIWEAVDSDRLTAFAIGGHEVIRLPDTKGIPALRSASGRGFTLLRPQTQFTASWPDILGGWSVRPHWRSRRQRFTASATFS